MNILVTGGAGFIGSNLVRQLQQSDPEANLLVVDDFSTGSFDLLSSEGEDVFSFRGELIARPLGEIDLVDLITDFEPEIIFHEASITDTTVTDQAKMIQDNVEPFAALLEVCIERELRLVWASSAATYGISANGAVAARRPFRLEDAGQPANVYGFSKWLMENMHRQTLKEHPHLHLVGLRYFNVFGPGEHHKGRMASMIYQLAQQILAGGAPRIFHDGEQARDQIYVKDVVEATIAAAADSAQSGIYNIGTGRATTFNQIVNALNDALGTRHAPDYFDNPYEFYQEYTCADLTATQQGLSWSPRYRPEDAIREYAQQLQAETSTERPKKT